MAILTQLGLANLKASHLDPAKQKNRYLIARKERFVPQRSENRRKYRRSGAQKSKNSMMCPTKSKT